MAENRDRVGVGAGSPGGLDGQNHAVILVGAGPTGMTVARGLLDQGLAVVLIDANAEGVGGGARDYIFWNKDKLKLGIMRKFPDTLSHGRFRYFGNVQLGDQGDVTLAQLQALGPVVLTCGSRGSKELPVEGADAQCVYDANVIVLKLNARWLIGRTRDVACEDHFPLPRIGNQIALVGMGNVVADTISHLATMDQKAQTGRQVTVFVRRGPFANKIAPVEMKWILHTIDKGLLQEEIRRIMGLLVETEPDSGLQAGWESDVEIFQQNLEIVLKVLHIKPKVWAEMPESIPEGKTRVGFHFFTQIARIHQKEGAVSGADLQQKLAGSETATVNFPFDTVIYSVGAAVDTTLGLESSGGVFAPDADFPYRIQGQANTFMAGWARQPSMGLAGVAVKEGKAAVQAIAGELGPIEDDGESGQILAEVQSRLEASLNAAGKKDWITAELAKERLESELEKSQVLSFVEIPEGSSLNS